MQGTTHGINTCPSFLEQMALITHSVQSLCSWALAQTRLYNLPMQGLLCSLAHTSTLVPATCMQTYTVTAHEPTVFISHAVSLSVASLEVFLSLYFHFVTARVREIMK